MRCAIEHRVAELAASQLGLITTEQLAELGASRAEVRALLAGGLWERLSRRVLRDRASPRTDLQQAVAAVLDVPREAVVTGSSAAALWGFDSFPVVPVHVLAKRGSRHRCRLGFLHETFWLPDHHRSCLDGVPVVSAARLPFELAAQERRGRVERVVDGLLARGATDVASLALAVAELCRRGRPGSRMMREIVDDRAPGYVPPASELERRFLDLCRRSGLAEPVRQHRAGGELPVGRVDFAYPAARLLIELDSRRWHDTSTAFDDDRRRTNALVAAGWRVVRITWRMIHDQPDQVVALLRELLVDVA